MESKIKTAPAAETAERYKEIINLANSDFTTVDATISVVCAEFRQHSLERSDQAD